MGNNYFQFKQFRIEQGGAAMKVSTEGCLLGAIAWCGEQASVLDIGSGSGLLALMLAQKTGGPIICVEADRQAAEQTLENIHASPWSSRITLVNETIQHYTASAQGQFDLIISNPPFYTNYLPSDDIRRKLAKHTYALSMDDLAMSVHQLLEKDGSFYVLYPPYEAGLFASVARKHGLYPRENNIVKNKANGPIFRMITCYSRQKGESRQNEIVIKGDDDHYTPEFVGLLRPYYQDL